MHGPQNALVQRLRRAVAPAQRIAIQPRLLRVSRQPFARDRIRVAMQQPRRQQFARDERHAARCMKLVHIGRAVRIDASKQRHDRRNIREIVPVDNDACRLRHRGQVQRMIGRSPRRHQADDRIHDGPGIHDIRHRAFTSLRQFHASHSRRPHQRIAQRRARIDERRAGQVQPHQLHHHLVGIGRAVEGTRPRRVIARRLRFQQLLARNLAQRELLAHLGFLLVADARRHRPRRREDHRQMPEAERADHQTRHDLVARPQHQRCVERIVRQRHRRAHRDHIAREQRQLHSRPPLSHAIAHGRHAARHLRRRARLPRRVLDDVGIVLERLVRAQHVVVAGDDADIRRPPAHGQLVAQRYGGECMRQVPAR